jgi:rare lipoprotein A
MKRTLVAVAIFLAYACRTTAPAPVTQPEVLHGVASWYGQEFAGRTTANGEIFDPMLLTAAHRTLPFGTIVEVKNAKTGKSVRVRVNDRGPYIGNRLIDLSYAAAQQIGLVEPGSGEVDLNVVAMGKGEREPPAPYAVTVAEAAPPPVEVTPPAAPKSAPEAGVPTQVPTPAPAVVDQVQVIEEHHNVETRRQVAANGKTIETVPVMQPPPQPAPPATATPAPTPNAVRPTPSGKYVVQVGAFADPNNAALLQQKLRSEGFDSFVDKGPALQKVQIGPFETREEAVKMRARLEAAGISAIIITSAQTR